MFVIDAYQRVIFKAFNFTQPAWGITSITFFIFGGIGTLFLEIHNVLKLFYYNLKGVSDLTEYGLNPKEITPEQAKLPAVILIPGLRHSHGVWIEFAKSCKRNEIKNPIFTVNIGKTPSDDISNTIEKIQQLYFRHGTDVKVDLVGYSAGGNVAYKFKKVGKTFKHIEKVRNIILLGTPVPHKIKTTEIKNVYLIRGTLDFLAPITKSTNSINVNSGHFGLPYANKTHKAIQTLIIKEPSESEKFSHFYSKFW